MTEALSPTKERLRHAHVVDLPIVDQSTKREATVIGDVFKKMFMSGELLHAEWKAAEKFERHLLGIEGHDVRQIDETGGFSDPTEMPAFQRHGIALASARKELSPREFQVLERLIKVPEETPLTIGKALSTYTNRQQQRAYGVAVIQAALDRLSLLWGFQQKQKVPSR
jgi:hypothetical protein